VESARAALVVYPELGELESRAQLVVAHLRDATRMSRDRSPSSRRATHGQCAHRVPGVRFRIRFFFGRHRQSSLIRRMAQQWLRGVAAGMAGALLLLGLASYVNPAPAAGLASTKAATGLAGGFRGQLAAAFAQLHRLESSFGGAAAARAARPQLPALAGHAAADKAPSGRQAASEPGPGSLSMRPRKAEARSRPTVAPRRAAESMQLEPQRRADSKAQLSRHISHRVSARLRAAELKRSGRRRPGSLLSAKSPTESEWVVTGTPPFAANWVSASGDILFHFNPRSSDGEIVMNTMDKGTWGPEERVPLAHAGEATWIVKVDEEGFHVFSFHMLGDQRELHMYVHRLPWASFSRVETSGDVDVREVQGGEEEDALSGLGNSTNHTAAAVNSSHAPNTTAPAAHNTTASPCRRHGCEGYVSPASLGAEGAAAFHEFIMQHDNYSIAAGRARAVAARKSNRLPLVAGNASGGGNGSASALDSGDSEKSSQWQLGRGHGPVMVNTTDGSRWYLPRLRPIPSVNAGWRGFVSKLPKPEDAVASASQAAGFPTPPSWAAAAAAPPAARASPGASPPSQDGDAAAAGPGGREEEGAEDGNRVHVHIEQRGARPTDDVWVLDKDYDLEHDLRHEPPADAPASASSATRSSPRSAGQVPTVAVAVTVPVRLPIG